MVRALAVISSALDAVAASDGAHEQAVLVGEAEGHAVDF